MSNPLPPYALPVAAGAVVLAVLGLAVRAVLASRSASAVTAPLSEAEHKQKLEQDAARMTQAREVWRRRLVVWTLVVSFVLSFVIAVGAGWLSFGNQRQYALGANGGLDSEATVFALLLDAGALAFSLMRLFEAITGRSSNLTRGGLVGFIVASTTMNLLHAHHEKGQAPTLGAILYVIIPPLVYAALLEMLLWKTEQLVLGKYKKRKASIERGYSLLMWLPWPIGFPVRLWKEWRKDLRATIANVRAPMSTKPLPVGAELSADDQAQAQQDITAVAGSGALDPSPDVYLESPAEPAAHPGAADGAPQLQAQPDTAPQGASGAPVDLVKPVRLPEPVGSAQLEGEPQESGGAPETVSAVQREVEPEAETELITIAAQGTAQAVADAAHPAEVEAQAFPAQAQPVAQAVPVTLREPQPVVEYVPLLPPAAEPVASAAVPALSQDTRSPRAAVRIEAPAPSADSSKKDVLRDALLDGIRDGDMRIFSADPQVANRVAYALNDRLFREEAVNKATVRRYVKELLPELQAARTAATGSSGSGAQAEAAATERHLDDLAPVELVEETVVVGSEQAQADPQGEPQGDQLHAVEGEPVTSAQFDGSAQGEPGAVDEPLEEVRRAEPVEAAHFEGEPQQGSGAPETEPQEAAAHLKEVAAQGGAAQAQPVGSAQLEGVPQESGGAPEGEPHESAAHPGGSPTRADAVEDEDEEGLVLGLIGQRSAGELAGEIEYAHSL